MRKKSTKSLKSSIIEKAASIKENSMKGYRDSQTTMINVQSSTVNQGGEDDDEMVKIS